MVFAVNGTSFGRYVKAENYHVREDRETSRWTDANRRAHTKLIRKKAVGTFTMEFPHMDEYMEFVNAVDAARQDDDSVPITVFCVNAGHVRTGLMDINFDPEMTKDGSGLQVPEPFTVEIEEV